MTQTPPPMRWKAVSLNPKYRVSDHGLVQGIKGTILRPGRTKSGHLTVHIAGVGSVYVHALVAEAFVGPRPSPKHEVRHDDGDPGNNFWRNLEWATRGRNTQDKKRHAGQKGLLSLDDVQRIKRRLNKGEKGRELAFEYGVGESAISAIKRGHNHAEVQP